VLGWGRAHPVDDEVGVHGRGILQCCRGRRVLEKAVLDGCKKGRNEKSECQYMLVIRRPVFKI
jgi:hypothetical protein